MRRPVIELGKKCACELSIGDGGDSIGIKVAIGALVETVGDVDVEGEGGHLYCAENRERVRQVWYLLTPYSVLDIASRASIHI